MVLAKYPPLRKITKQMACHFSSRWWQDRSFFQNSGKLSFSLHVWCIQTMENADDSLFHRIPLAFAKRKSSCEWVWAYGKWLYLAEVMHCCPMMCFINWTDKLWRPLKPGSNPSYSNQTISFCQPFLRWCLLLRIGFWYNFLSVCCSPFVALSSASKQFLYSLFLSFHNWNPIVLGKSSLLPDTGQPVILIGHVSLDRAWKPRKADRLD